MSAVRCLAWTPNKPGQRCGLEVTDSELLLCTKHARRERERRRLRERVEYRQHTIDREWRNLDGSPRDDWYFFVAEHVQVAEPVHSMLERHCREEIDRCSEERLAGCLVYIAPPPSSGVDWDRFKLSRNDWSHT
jgi:hypothetical protein